MDVNDNAGCLNARIVLAFFASGLAPTGSTEIFVGAGLPAMDVNDNSGYLNTPHCPRVFREQARSYRFHANLCGSEPVESSHRRDGRQR